MSACSPSVAASRVAPLTHECLSPGELNSRRLLLWRQFQESQGSVREALGAIESFVRILHQPDGRLPVEARLGLLSDRQGFIGAREVILYVYEFRHTIGVKAPGSK